MAMRRRSRSSSALWQDRLVTLFRHHTGDHAIAEDLAQEVFLRVYRARATYQPTAKFTTWIHTIANNVASDLRQRAYRRKERGVPAERVGIDERHRPRTARRRRQRPQAGAAGRPQRTAATSCRRRSRRSPSEQRMAVLLAKFEQCSYEEIAAAMGLTVPAVKSLLFRARDQLREPSSGPTSGRATR